MSLFRFLLTLDLGVKRPSGLAASFDLNRTHKRMDPTALRLMPSSTPLLVPIHKKCFTRQSDNSKFRYWLLIQNTTPFMLLLTTFLLPFIASLPHQISYWSGVHIQNCHNTLRASGHGSCRTWLRIQKSRRGSETAKIGTNEWHGIGKGSTCRRHGHQKEQPRRGEIGGSGGEENGGEYIGTVVGRNRGPVYGWSTKSSSNVCKAKDALINYSRARQIDIGLCSCRHPSSTITLLADGKETESSIMHWMNRNCSNMLFKFVIIFVFIIHYYIP